MCSREVHDGEVWCVVGRVGFMAGRAGCVGREVCDRTVRFMAGRVGCGEGYVGTKCFCADNKMYFDHPHL